MQNLYLSPNQNVMQMNAYQQKGAGMTDAEEQAHFDEFFEEVFTEMEEKYGEVEEMNVTANLGEHLLGNTYVKFRREEDAERAVQMLNNRWFNGQPIYAELSPVTDFREACCRQYETGDCNKGGYCNFLHLKQISRDLRRRLHSRHRAGGGPPPPPTFTRRGERSRSRERGGGGGGGRRDRSRSPRGGGGGGDRRRR